MDGEGDTMMTHDSEIQYIVEPIITMIIFYWIIIMSWLAFLGYWAIAAIGIKKDVTKGIWWGNQVYIIRIRLIAAVIVILLVIARFSSINHFFAYRPGAMGNVVAEIGAMLCALGIALAIWARFHLGKNWSSHPALKENHELITSGPYRFVRHPIYTGILFAELGTMLAIGYVWLIPLIFGVIVFVRRVSIEERMMMNQFPNTYPAYKRHTKALIPFVW